MKYNQVLQFARELRKKQTPAEKFFWEKVRRKNFMGLKFDRQYILEHSEVMGEKSFFIPDFHCYAKKLIVEIDGGIHKQQNEYDDMREDVLKEMGYMIVRFKNEEVLNNWDLVNNKLEEIIRNRTLPASLEREEKRHGALS